VAVLVSCGGPVEVTPPTPDAASAAACAKVVAELPSTVASQPTADHTPTSPLTQAWGDPPIVLRCGVAAPAALRPDSQLVTVNGVDWLPEQTDAGYRFTTVGRIANVEVTVPTAYAPEGAALVDVAGAVRSLDPAR
jgi:hypothetical protein